MIESTFLSSSTWDSDLFQDFSPVLEVPPSNFEEYVNNLESENVKMSSCSTTPNDRSSSSSDYEGLTLDDLDVLLPISDTFVSQILDDDNAIGFSDLDWFSFTDGQKYNSPVSSITKSISHASQKTKSLECLQSTKLWSRMSPGEQLQTLHALSEIVTCHMGIREQMEVIKIIDPSAVISPDDKEFALDSSCLNDAKLRRVQDYVRRQKSSLRTTAKSMNSSSSNIMPAEKSSAEKVISRKVSSSSYCRTKRRQKKQKNLFSDEVRKLQRKLKRQGKKEEQSGLFVYEKMIKKLSNPLEEEEEVNILE